MTDEHDQFLPEMWGAAAQECSKITFFKICLGKYGDGFVYYYDDKDATQHRNFTYPHFDARHVHINIILFTLGDRWHPQLGDADVLVSKDELTQNLLTPMLYLLSDFTHIFLNNSDSQNHPELL